MRCFTLPVMIPILDGSACFLVERTNLSFVSNNLIWYVRHGDLKKKIVDLDRLVDTRKSKKKFPSPNRSELKISRCRLSKLEIPSKFSLLSTFYDKLERGCRRRPRQLASPRTL